MITFVHGILRESGPLHAVVEVHGVGYEVNVPLSTAAALPSIGQNVLLHTHAVYREDNQALYGFMEPEDRAFFRLLVDVVSGVGPKLALNLLSRMSATELQTAVRGADAAALARCPGIGKKTAERMILELRDRIGKDASVSPSPVSAQAAPEADTISALMALGYKAADAEKLAKKAIAELGGEASTEDLLRKALR